MKPFDPRIPPDVDELVLEAEEAEEPYEAAGPGRAHHPVGDPTLSDWGEDESGHAWQQYFHEPVRETYGGAGGSGEMVPYGGRRFAWGRESSVAREYGQLYGRDQRDFGHRRDSFYARAEATPWWDKETETDDAEAAFAGVGPRGWHRPDERIEEEIVQRLADAEWVDASDVEVEVSDGVVTLSGEVETRAERRAAEEIAAEVSGVVDVVDELRARQLRRRRPLS